MTTYNWQQSDWPNFRYDLSDIHETLIAIAEKTGLISGKMSHLSKQLQTETMIDFVVEEAIKTSEIEGEHISRPDIRTSIKNILGLNPKHINVHDKRAPGIVELLYDARDSFQKPLTQTKLFDWHLKLLSASTNPDLRIGYWRTHNEPMQIVSGYHGKWIVHFEAPLSQHVPIEMKKFIKWYNSTAPGQPNAITFGPVRAAIAHLYFESIHPFEDGNGRIGRAIAEKALSQSVGYPVLFSLSSAIEAEKKAYYAALNSASTSNEITNWIHYFVSVILTAQIETEKKINFILKKTTFFETFKNNLNERQMKVVKKLFETGMKGFEGGMSAKKYMAITNTSKATATRDLQHLVEINALKQIGGGRSVRYELNLEG